LAIARPYLNCAPHGGSSQYDRWPNIDRADRLPSGGSNDRRRYTGVDRETLSTITENNSSIDHDGSAKNHVVLAPL
jgi:hypothetical protein